jgi:uncharacterized integral membrane protein
VIVVVVALVVVLVSVFIFHKLAPRQVVLSFGGVDRPAAVAVDTARTVYVADWGNNRVLKLQPH